MYSMNELCMLNILTLVFIVHCMIESVFCDYSLMYLGIRFSQFSLMYRSAMVATTASMPNTFQKHGIYLNALTVVPHTC